MATATATLALLTLCDRLNLEVSFFCVCFLYLLTLTFGCI